MENLYPILLTASVDTRGMKSAMFPAPKREQMYIDTLNFYIDDLSKRKGNYSLVFAENSGWQPNLILEKLHKADNVDLEYLALDPEKFDISKGKSYNEFLLLDMATLQSEKVQKAGRFFKVTGRYPIKNIYSLLKEVNRGGKSALLL